MFLPQWRKTKPVIVQAVNVKITASVMLATVAMVTPPKNRRKLPLRVRTPNAKIASVEKVPNARIANVTPPRT